jgi:D-3-phosphoglycerate dehydrogenase
MKVFIATSTFGDFSNESIDHLRQNELDVCMNKLGRKLTDNELIKFAAKCDGIIAGTENYSRPVLERLPHLKVISRLGIGMDNIDIEAAKEREISVYKTITSPAPAVAELTLGLMLDVARAISEHTQSIKSGIWQKKVGILLQGKTLGIIGLGVIGKTLVHLAKGFNNTIIAYDICHDERFATENRVTYCNLNQLLLESDIVSIHLNLTKKNIGLISEELIETMKPGSILINTSRGQIVDEVGLFKALKEKRILGAGLDVFGKEPYSGPLTELENVVLTPHIGGYAEKVRTQMEIEAAQNLVKGLLLDEK